MLKYYGLILHSKQYFKQSTIDSSNVLVSCVRDIKYAREFPEY